MAKFRLLLILLALWLVLLFNIERPDVLASGQSIDLASFVYVLAAGIILTMLMFPDMGKERFELVAAPFLVLYLILKIIISLGQTADFEFLFFAGIEVGTILVTIAIGRLVSVAVSGFEDAVENAVLSAHRSRVLSMAEGEEQINHELFRARRFDRPVSILYVRNSVLPDIKALLTEQFDLEAAFRRRYLLNRIAQIVEGLTYRSDVIAWHNDNIVVCLPETSRDEALIFAKQMHTMLKMRLNIDIKLGLASFPQDALIYADLIDAALQHPLHFEETMRQPGPPSGGPSQDQGAPPRDPARETRELDSVGRGIWQVLKSFVTAPVLFPLDGMPILPSSSSDVSADPTFWVNYLPYQGASARAIYRQVKRAFDLAIVVLTLPLVLLLSAAIALAIRLSGPGPILFRQQRTGQGGHRFTMYKFRTMVPNAEQLLRDLAAQGLAKLDGEGKLAEPLKLSRDPRVTRIGRILRKTSLDELPQLWNVLCGEMSLVGPRPTSWNVDSYTLFQTERLGVRPGITGLWQIYSRGSTDFDNWVHWDMKYIDKMSLSLDLQILVRTVLKVFAGSGAR